MSEIKPMPIVRFANIEEAKQYLRYWQHILYLDEWVIKLEIVPETDIPNCQGVNNTTPDLKACVIKIADIPQEKSDKHIVRYCQEATLVHELLHCFDVVTPVDEGTYEQMVFTALKHQQLEMLARSLIEAKYNLNKEFWVNT